MSSDGRRLLSALIVSQDLKTLGSMQLNVSMFKGTEVAMYEFVYNHVLHYGKLPSPETMMENVDIVGELIAVSEPAEFYLTSVEKRYQHSQLKEVVIKAQELLKNEDSGKAFEILTERIVQMMMQKNRHHLFDFRDAAKIILKELDLKKADSGEYYVKFGWPTLDGITGGLKGGDLIAIVGRPAMGKTFNLLYTAHNAWDKGHVPIFFSMEMVSTIIMQRLATMNVHYPLMYLLKGTISDHVLSNILEKLGENKTKKPFWITDGNLATTVDDIILQCRQLKPDVVYVDGAYLLHHKNQKLGQWERMRENAEMLKQRVATDLNIPVLCSYQFSKESKKKKKKEDKVGLEDIYGSDAIAQLSTVILGLFEEESVKTMKSRKVEILKGRNGETGKFEVNWNFHKMDFSEILVEDTEDLQFVK